jgi:hypothetical protein
MNSSSLMNDIYGPLNRNYCIYFYALSVLGFVLLSITFLSMILMLVTKKISSESLVHMLMIAVGYGIFYFQNRLLYSMCIGNSELQK